MTLDEGMAMGERAYAYKTGTSVGASRDEIEKVLKRYGADCFAFGSEPGRVAVQFRVDDRQIRFIVPLPTGTERALTHTGAGKPRSEAQRQAAYDAELRRRWRCLLLAIKSKLEVVACGIETLEEAFMAQIVLPDGTTVSEQVLPAIEASYAGGGFNPSMLGLPPGEG